MLEHQRSERSTPRVEPGIGPAPRATPEELVAAIAEIERRKAAQAQVTEGTVDVADTVRELGVDCSPEEVVAQLEAGRKARATAQAKQPRAKRRFKRRLKSFAAILLVLVGFTWFGTWSVREAAMHPTPAVLSSPITTTLASIPENHPVTCDSANLQLLVQTGNKAKILVTDGLDVMSAPWTLVKLHGHVYVRGFLQSQMTQGSLNLGPVTLYNAEWDANTDMGQPTPVNLRTDEMTVISTGGTGLDLTAKLDHVKLDNQAYAQW